MLVSETLGQALIALAKEGFRITAIIEDSGEFAFITSDCFVCHSDVLTDFIKEESIPHAVTRVNFEKVDTQGMN
jgi:hypothetical protein